MSGIGLIISLILANNLVLDYALGIGPALASSRKFEVAVGFAATALVVIPFVTVLSFIVAALLAAAHLVEYSLMAIVLLVASLLLLIERYLRRHRSQDWQRLGVFLPLLTLNSAVVGAVVLAIEQPVSILMALYWGIGLAGGLAVTVVMLAGLRERIAADTVPEPFAGIPIALITLGIMSLGLLGFAGMTR